MGSPFARFNPFFSKKPSIYLALAPLIHRIKWTLRLSNEPRYPIKLVKILLVELLLDGTPRDPPVGRAGAGPEEDAKVGVHVVHVVVGEVRVPVVEARRRERRVVLLVANGVGGRWWDGGALSRLRAMMSWL